MKARPAAAACFVVFCLLLCGLILRRQIAGHPLPPEAKHSYDFHPAGPALTQQAQESIQGQVAALSAGDGRKAFSYQSQALRRRFADAGQFLQMIRVHYPEFGQNRAVHYGPVWTNTGSTRAQVQVRVDGKNGRQVQGVFQLVREGSALKIDGFAPVGGFGGARPFTRNR